MVFIPKTTLNPASSKDCARTTPALRNPVVRAEKSKEGILKAVRAAIDAAGGRITRSRFLAESGMKSSAVLRYHTGWNALLREAGCTREASNSKVDPERLLADWGGVVRKLKRVPSWNEYRVHGEYDPSTFVQNFEKWSKVTGEFRMFAGRRAGWKDVMALLPPSTYVVRMMREAGRVESRRRRGKGVPRLADRPVRGDRLGIEGMARAPVNEHGVVFLFGLLAVRLGFEVESMQSSFPDCEATRRMETGAWQTVRIEFEYEYESRNFRSHRHDAEGCDVIVCWVNNWPECPKGIEVIALKDEIERLGSGVA